MERFENEKPLQKRIEHCGTQAPSRLIKLICLGTLALTRPT